MATGVAGLLGAGLAACGSGAALKPPTAPTTPSVGTGCGSHSSAGASTLALTVQGRARVVRVHVPLGYTGSTKEALILNMHGSGSTASGQEVFSGMDRTSDADGFVVAYPQADITAGAGYDWNIPGVPLVGGKPVPTGAADDEVYLKDVVTTLERQLCIDASRVYATGFSGGAADVEPARLRRVPPSSPPWRR